MSIEVQNQTFLLKMKHSVYAFAVTKENLLRHLYWGAPVAMTDLPDPDQEYSLCSFLREQRNLIRRQELSGLSREFFTEPGIFLIFPDHVRTAEFHYDSYSIQEEHLTVFLKEIRHNVLLELHYLLHPEYDLIDRWCVLINKAPLPITVKSIQSANWYPPRKTAKRLSYLSGRWGMEHQINQIPVSHTKIQMESRTGLSGPFSQPFFAFDDGTADEDKGEVYFGALQWSGNWKIAVEMNSCNEVSVSGGINDFDFSLVLEPQKKFTAPVFTGGYTDGGFGMMSHILHDYQRQGLMPQAVMKNPMPLLFNSWCTLGIDVSTEKILSLAEKAAKLGVELFVIDDGWQKHLGDWVADPAKFPEGLAPVAKKLREAGMQFGLWVEIEQFEQKSDLYKKHPDWALRFDAFEPEFTYRGDIDRTSCVLNLARPEVQKYLYDSLDKLLAETGIGYLKLDFNAYWSNPGWESVPPEHQQSVNVAATKGLYSIFARLHEKYPEVIFENCAAGCGRPDLGMMRYFSRINRCDNQDPLDAITMHEGFTWQHPSRSAGGAAHISEQNMNGRSCIPLQYRAFAGMMGALAIGLDLSALDDATFEQVRQYGVLYKKLRHITHFGDMYRLRSIRKENCAIFEFVTKDKTEALVFIFGASMQFCEPPEPYYLKGLLPEQQYKLTIYGESKETKQILRKYASGSHLMNIPQKISLKGDLDSLLLHYQQIPETADS